MVFNPVGLAAVVIGVVGAVMTFLGSTLSGFPWAQLETFGPLLIALAFALGAVALGLRNPYIILVLFFIVAVLFIGFDVFSWGGLHLI